MTSSAVGVPARPPHHVGHGDLPGELVGTTGHGGVGDAGVAQQHRADRKVVAVVRRRVGGGAELLLSTTRDTAAGAMPEGQIAEDTAIPAAIEEVLRYRPPVSFLYRITKEPVRLGDLDVPAGRIVVSWLISSNRDELQFSEPDVFGVHELPVTVTPAR